jgi:S-DNA-T family DNA segregation ATPase FtsK/SpoIIIE
MASTKTENGINYAKVAILGALALFATISLLSYDWKDISLLQMPPNEPPANLIGPVGAWLSFALFNLLGVGAYLVPLFLFIMAVLMAVSGEEWVRARVLWTAAVMVTLCGLLELHTGWLSGFYDSMNLPQSGGIFSRVLIQGMLVQWLSPVGAGMLLIAAFVLSAVMAVEVQNVVRGCQMAYEMWVNRGANRTARDEDVADAKEAEKTTEKVAESAQKGLGAKRTRRAEPESQSPELPLPVAKVAPKPEAKPEPKPEPRPEPKFEPKPEPKPPMPRPLTARPLADPMPPVRPAVVPPKETPKPVAAEPAAGEPGGSLTSDAASAPVHGDAAAEAPKKVAVDLPAKKPLPKPAPKPASDVVVASGADVPYQLPPLSLLEDRVATKDKTIRADTATTSRILVETLADFGIEVQVTNVETGPVVTRYELLPAPGVRLERISALANNLALSLKATSVRVQAPIPGKGVVGVEVPNEIAKMVTLREVLESETWLNSRAALPLALGKDVGGNDLVADLARMPHMLIAGATGAGKTVCMNAILAGLLMSRTPQEMRLMLVDPKIVEFTPYNHLPHLVVPVITDPKKVALGLRWAILEMEKRYKLFAKAGVRNIESFNSREIVTQGDLFSGEGGGDTIPARVPYIVVVIDELADLMLADQTEIENCIARLAQLSRAVGIHMILSTQRPSVNVITGTIKANFPARIAFQVAQKVDSRTILDTVGADKLLGRGDMLFLPPGTSKLVRAQGGMVADDEIRRIVDFIRKQGEPEYVGEIKEKLEKPEPKAGAVDDGEGVDESLVEQSIEIIRETRRASTSSLQRRLRIGYTRAARIMDILEERGIVGPPRGSDPREILIDLDGEIPANTSEPTSET